MRRGGRQTCVASPARRKSLAPVVVGPSKASGGADNGGELLPRTTMARCARTWKLRAREVASALPVEAALLACPRRRWRCPCSVSRTTMTVAASRRLLLDRDGGRGRRRRRQGRTIAAAPRWLLLDRDGGRELLHGGDRGRRRRWRPRAAPLLDRGGVARRGQRGGVGFGFDCWRSHKIGYAGSLL